MVSTIAQIGKESLFEFSDPMVNRLYRFKDRIDFIESIKKDKILDYQEKPRFIHLSYDFGRYLVDPEIVIDQEKIIAWEIVYQDFSPAYLDNNSPQIELRPENEIPFEFYRDRFLKVQNHLFGGDSYQVNLTFPFKFELLSQNLTAKEWASVLWKNFKSKGEFGHITVDQKRGLGLISNSPECLFEMDGTKLHTRPIKGSISYQNEDEIEEKWAELKESEKDRAELFIITDLLRNDLSRIDLPKSKVISLREKVVVPGIVHQYSHISVDLAESTNLFQIIDALLPGGSVTGAPKKRTVEIIEELEVENRDFYCGSTLMMWKNYKCASINIRTAQQNKKSLSYSAGGGITVQSDCLSEYQEMLTKRDSFFNLLTGSEKT